MTGSVIKTAGVCDPKPGARLDAGFHDFLSAGMSERDLNAVMQHADRHGLAIVEAVVDLGFMNETKAYASFAEWMGRPFVDLQAAPPAATAARLLPERVAKARQVLPLAHDNRTLTYASATS